MKEVSDKLVGHGGGAAARRQTDALGRYSEFAFDANGNLTSKTDPLDNTRTFVYDSVNRLRKKEYEADGWVGYKHDANGNMTTASDGTITFKFTYDALNRTTKVRDDTEGLLVQYSYDANGNLLTIEDTAENTIAYYYDKLNRVTDIARRLRRFSI